MINIIFAVLQLLLAIGIIGFWISFFKGDSESKMSEVEYKHEKSFPLPDLGWVTPTSIISAIGLLLDQPFGYLFCIIAGSGMMFLGLIDLAFNYQNDQFSREKRGFDAIMSIIIVSIMLIFGPIFIIYGSVYFLF